MRKTNSKEVNKYFDDYLNDILTDNFDGSITAMSEQFYASTCNTIGKLQAKWESYQEAFETITQNYATCWYSEMQEMLMEALDQTREEAEKYSDDKTKQLFNYLLYKAYLRRCKKDNVRPFLHRF